MRHTELWKAVDLLAERHGLSPSGLARRAGLDPTAFNKSKRAAPDGPPRWLSTESLMKALGAVGVSLEDFAALAEGRQGHTLVAFQEIFPKRAPGTSNMAGGQQ